MRQWYYAQDGKSTGPLEEEVLRSLFLEQRLDRATLVWTEGMQDWLPAHTFEQLVPPEEEAPPVGPPPIPERDPADRWGSGKEPGSAREDHWGSRGDAGPAKSRPSVASKPTVHPWLRYWARYIDVAVFGFLCGPLVEIFYPRAFLWPDWVFAAVFLLSFAFVEPVLLSTFGATPGKALLGIRVRNRDGSRLDYKQAFDRSFKVYLRGVGLGIFLLAVFQHLRAYGRLMNEGTTSWDREGKFVVEHAPLSSGRSLVAILIVLGILTLALAGEPGLWDS